MAIVAIIPIILKEIGLAIAIVTAARQVDYQSSSSLYPQYVVRRLSLLEGLLTLPFKRLT
jgi:hypothetical protein